MARIHKNPYRRDVEDRRNEGREHPSSLANRNQRRLQEMKEENRSQVGKPAKRKK